MIQSSPIARNICVIFDSHLDMNVHITSMCRLTMYYMRQISSICRFLDRGGTETLIHALSIADWIIALCYLLNCQSANWLSSASTKYCRKNTNIYQKARTNRPVPYSLHSLPVRARIEFKVITMTFKCLHGMAPEYVTELLVIHKPPHDLHSAMELKLCKRHANRKSAWSISFSNVAVKLFNSLPNDLRETTSLTTFRSKLNTLLFLKLYHGIMVNWSCKA